MKDGWGLATDGKVLFGSDGSSTLYQLDPRTFKGLPLMRFYSFPFLHLNAWSLPQPLISLPLLVMYFH